MPRVVQAPLIYLGVAAFVAALVLAMLEQHVSGKAYQRQVEITQAYYTRQSTDTHDPAAIRRVRILRKSSYIFFGLAILLSTVGMMLLR